MGQGIKRRSRFDNTKVLKFSHKAAQELAEMRQDAENIGQGKLTNIAKILPGDVLYTKIDGVEYGYKVEDYTYGGLAMEPFYLRKIFVKFPGYKLVEIPEPELRAFVVAVLETCVDKGNDRPEIEKISDDAIVITQRFMPSLLTNTQPWLVSIAGGFDG